MCTCKPRLKGLKQMEKTCLNIESLGSDSDLAFVNESESESEWVFGKPIARTKQYQQEEKKSPTSNYDSSNG
jgi:hypothetical protein